MKDSSLNKERKEKKTPKLQTKPQRLREEGTTVSKQMFRTGCYVKNS